MRLVGGTPAISRIVKTLVLAVSTRVSHPQLHFGNSVSKSNRLTNGYLRKGRKTKPKRQNRTRNGKAGKDKSKSKPKPEKVNRKSTQVNSEAKSQEK
ncbi:hypothetical protein Tco_0491868 [Tanacetum coccineum]